ncbi:MAG: CHAT domain-containing protein [candidate division Zixibacteria bacterium]|nr:CHAT domain-containing protein [candidate division Zixibacteria bacterium]
MRIGLIRGSAFVAVALLCILLGSMPGAFAGSDGTGGMVSASPLQPSGPTRQVLGQVQVLEGLGDYEKAQHVLAAAIRGLEPDQSGLGLVDLAALQTRRSTFLIRLCRFAEAESALAPLLDRMESTYGKDARELIPVINALGDVRFQLGDYLHAERFYRRSLVLCRQFYGNDDRYAVAPLQGLARVLHKGHRMMNGNRYAERSYRAVPAMKDCTPLERAAAADCLGMMRRRIGVYGDAERYFREALAIVDSAYGTDHPAAAVYHNRLGDLYINVRRPVDAASEARMALDIAWRRLGPEHLETGQAIYNAALATLLSDSTADLRSKFDRVLAIRGRWLDPMHPDDAQIHEYYGFYHRLRGEFRSAPEQAAIASSIRRRDYVRNASDMIDFDAVFASIYVYYALSDELAYYFDSRTDDSATTRRVADELLTSKGYAFDDLLIRFNCLKARADAAGQADFGSLQRVRSEKAALHFRDPQFADPSNELLVDSLAWDEQAIVGRMADLTGGCREAELERPLLIDDVAALLPSGSVFINFFLYLRVTPATKYSEETRYGVLVIGKEGLRGLVDLGSVPVDSLVLRLDTLMIAATRAIGGFSDAIAAATDTVTQELYRRLWLPLEGLAPESLAIVTPDLRVGDLPFGALQSPTGEFVAAAHSIHYLSNARDFLRLPVLRTAKNTSLFALGSPDFDAPPAARKFARVGDVDVETLRPAGYVARNVRGMCYEFENMLLAPLPGTRAEVGLVAEDWKNIPGHEATVLTGAAASEEMVKWVAPGHRVIHLATHGYYLPQDCATPLVGPPGYSGEERLLQRTGLLLSGANLKGKGADMAGAEDGVLTADEISTLRLGGTDLVILSACESGQGFGLAGQGGAFSLRRAFQVAGARTVISSIWPVGDHVTLELMDRLYKDTTQTYAAILSQYARDKINQARAAGRFPDPSEWASFVVSGDWRR